MKTLLLLILCHTSFSQTELAGAYQGPLSEGKETIIELNITKADSLIILGSGTYPDDQKFTVQEMDVDNGFISAYKALVQIQFFEV